MHEIVRYAEKTGKADVERLRAVAMGIARTLGSLAAQLGAKYLFGDAKFLEPLADLKSEDLTRHFKKWSSYHSEIEGIKRDFKCLVDLVLGSSAGVLTIFLDDLDRCLPDSVVRLLEAVKLLLCGQHDSRVTFIFGLDRQIVGEAIAQRYPDTTVYSGESYLEKIFDLSLEVPVATSTQVEAFIRHLWPQSLAGLVEATMQPFGGVILVSDVLADAGFANPRVIKRALNRLVLFQRSTLSEGLARRLTNDETRRRFVAWVAGAERFRAFRYAFMDATPREVEGLHDFVLKGTVAQMSPRLLRIAMTPAFRRYYALLGLERSDWTATDAQRSSTSPDKVPLPALSLRDFDDALRAVGL